MNNYLAQTTPELQTLTVSKSEASAASSVSAELISEKQVGDYTKRQYKSVAPSQADFTYSTATGIVLTSTYTENKGQVLKDVTQSAGTPTIVYKRASSVGVSYDQYFLFFPEQKKVVVVQSLSPDAVIIREDSTSIELDDSYFAIKGIDVASLEVVPFAETKQKLAKSEETTVQSSVPDLNPVKPSSIETVVFVIKASGLTVPIVVGGTVSVLLVLGLVGFLIVKRAKSVKNQVKLTS